EEVVRGVDLVVLATKSNATLDTARELVDAIGETPVLSVASDLAFSDIGVLPGREERSLAEEVSEIVRGPVASGLQSLSAAHLAAPELPDEDAFICGDDARAKELALELASRLVGGRAVDVGPLADSRRLEVILREAKRIVRTRPPLVIAETRHGFVCASAGVDSSNAPEPDTVVLLPDDPDASASRLRERLRDLTGAEIGVIVSDSFGRPWRQGTTDVAIGASGIRPLLDLKGERDAAGYELHATMIAVADELVAAAELVLGKTSGIPAAVIRGAAFAGEGSARDLLMPAERDLFR